MAAHSGVIKDSNNDDFYPLTYADTTYMQDNTTVESAINSLRNAGFLRATDIYPVGSIVTFYDTADHSNFLGLTWTRFAAGKMVVGYDSSDTDFDTIGNTGGVKTVTLTVDQIPSHRHSTTSAGSRGKAQADTSGTSGYAWNSDSGGYTGYSGGGQAHNNMPPYITAALWRRTV